MNSAEFRSALTRRARHARVSLTSDLTDRLEQYFQLLARWNLKINLTALPLAKPTDETFDRLLIEPLLASASIANQRGRWFDLGSGGGSPAIPIKLAKPELELTMVESKVRKAAFLRDAVRQLELARAEVENVRFEELLDKQLLGGSADLVSVRAVRVDEGLISACRYLIRDGGKLLLFGFKGSNLTGFRQGTHAGLFVRQCST